MTSTPKRRSRKAFSETLGQPMAIISMKNKRGILSLCIIILFILGSLNLSLIVAAVSSGECYTTKRTYQYGENVIVNIATSTGINNTRVLIYLPNEEVNTFTIGRLGTGAWQFSIGPAASPIGQRMVVLLDGSTTLSTTYYTVVQSSSTTTITVATATRTLTGTVTQTYTVTRFTTTFQTTTEYQTSTVSTTKTESSTVTMQTTTVTTQYQTLSTSSTVTQMYTIILPILGPMTLVYTLLAVIVLLIFAIVFVASKMAKK